MLNQFLNVNPTKIIAVSGSPGNGSSTATALKYVLRGAEIFGADTKLLELGDYNLVMSGTISESNYYEDVIKFREEVNDADGIIIGTPEYHNSLSGLLKSAIDLLTKEQFEGKVVGLVGVAGGELGATNSLNHLSTICRSLHCWVSPYQVSIGNSSKAFDRDKKLLDEEIKNRLIKLGHSVTRFASFNRVQKDTKLIYDFKDLQYSRDLRNNITNPVLNQAV